MATKPSDLLNRLPSVSELLEKPQVRALADRWNRSTVAAGVRSFLDELRSDLQRRSANAGIPSPRELAERAARHVVALQQHSQRPAINATGQILGACWLGTPLAEVALERVFAVGRHFIAGPKEQINDFTAGFSNEAAAALCRVTGAQACAIVHSYSGALWLAVAAIVSGREVVASRGDLGDVDQDCSLVDIIRSAGAQLREAGAINRVVVSHFEGAITPQTAAILRCAPDSYAVVSETDAVELESLVATARERELILIEALGAAPLADLSHDVAIQRRSVQNSLAAGADLVLARGDGLVGGPACGLIFGRRELIQQIVDHPLFTAWRIDALRMAALSSTVECYEAKSNGPPAVPVLELLTASVDNLRNRAERLAPQLSQAEDVAAVEPTATLSALLPAELPTGKIPSYGVTLTPASGNATELYRRLAASPRPVLGRIDGDRLVLDLRFVFPGEDQLLVEIVSGIRPPSHGT